MAYCGKSCIDCLEREEVGCPGCKMGPGKSNGGLCEIAKCCQEQCKEACTVCGMNASCDVLAGRDTMLQKWHEKRADEVAKSVNTVSKGVGDGYDAELLGKWLMILFWTFIPVAIGNSLSNMSAEGGLLLAVLGLLFTLVGSVVRGAILIYLGAEESAYRVTGILIFVSTALGVLLGLIDVEGNAILSLTFTVLVAVLDGICSYMYYVANATVLELRDRALSDKWRLMSKICLVTLGLGVVDSILVVFVTAVGVAIGLLLLVVAAILGICEFVYLYNTARCFQGKNN